MYALPSHWFSAFRFFYFETFLHFDFLILSNTEAEKW